MKILWCDDMCYDDQEFLAFTQEWNLADSQHSVLRARDDKEALEQLGQHPDVALLILDLLWGQPEDPSVRPLGVEMLVRIRKLRPTLTVATRSKVVNAQLLASLVSDFVKLHVVHHFLSHDDTFPTALRRRVLLESIGLESHIAPSEQSGMDVHLGQQWGVVLFADITGFSEMTEALWYQNRDTLAHALRQFYRMGIRIVGEHQGVVDKLIGDELMAIFFSPRGKPDEATTKSAVEAGVALVNGFREIERSFKVAISGEADSVMAKNWQLKVGLEGGSLQVERQELTAGRVEYCALGYAINLAARIKGTVGDYSVAIGPTAKNLLPQNELYELQAVVLANQLKGTKPNTKIFSLTQR